MYYIVLRLSILMLVPISTRCKTRLKNYPGTIHPLRLVAELQQLMTPEMTLCSDMDSFRIRLARYLYSFRTRQVLIRPQSGKFR
jgi:thiamine pyrophosphate-dependent acetolactate synthase large subunit-like protein